MCGLTLKSIRKRIAVLDVNPSQQDRRRVIAKAVKQRTMATFIRAQKMCNVCTTDIEVQTQIVDLIVEQILRTKGTQTQTTSRCAVA